MGFDLSDIELDLSLSDEGVEVEVGDGAYITVGRWGSRKFKRAVQKYAGNKFSQIQARMINRRKVGGLSLIHISEPTRQPATSRMPSSA